MKTISLLFLFFCTFYCNLFYAQTFKIYGVIIGNESAYFSKAKIEIDSLNKVVYSDQEGKFEIDGLSKGIYRIKVSYKGYESQISTVTLADSNKKVNFMMDESLMNFPEVILLHLSLTGGDKGIKDLPGSAYYLSPKELQKFSYSDPNRLLKTVPGVNIQEEDGFGLRPNIGLRGSGVQRSSKITIMEDGILMAPAPYSAPSAYYFPSIGRMQGLEILKGSAQIKYGPYTTGGAINLISTQLPKDFQVKINAIGGSYWSKNVHAFIGNSHERIAYSIEVFNYGSNGFKVLDGGGKTGFQKSDYIGKLQLNTKKSAKIQQSITFKAGLVNEMANETYVGLSKEDFSENAYRRYAGSQKDVMNAVQSQFSAMHYVQAKKWLSITSILYRNNFHRNWYKLEGVKDSLGSKIGIADILQNPDQYAEQFAIIKGQTSLNDDALYVKGNNRTYYGQGIQSIIGFDFKSKNISHDIDLGIRYHQDGMDRFQNEDKYKMTNNVMLQTTAGDLGRESNKLAFASALATYIQYKLNWEKLTVTAGLRNENIFLQEKDYGKNDPERNGTALIIKENKINIFIPGVALDLKINPYLSSFIGVHKGFAPPSAQAESKAEESVNVEAGLKIYKKEWSGQLVAYFNAYENLLGADLAASGGAGSGELYNGGKSKAQGIELLATYNFGSLISKKIQLPLTLSYTYTDARFLSNFNSTFEDWGNVNYGDELPYLSKHQLNTSISLEIKKVNLNLNAKYNSPMRAIAGQGNIDENSLIPSYFILDASANYKVNKNISVFASVTNLTNQIYIVSSRPAGLRPGMPRAIQIGLKAAIN
jgi:Fe(3+) dicitrate transport protein